VKQSSWYRDWYYGVAIIAAPLVWAVLYWINPPIVDPAWGVVDPLMFINLVLLQPTLEELVFRGLIQGWLIKQLWAGGQILGISFANMMTSLLFTALHFIYHEPLMAIAVFVPSLVFGYFRDRYDGWLVPCIGLHCFYNAGYFLIFGIY